MKKLIFEALPFLILGAAIGQGPFDLSDWQWWAWITSIIVSLAIRDEIRNQK